MAAERRPQPARVAKQPADDGSPAARDDLGAGRPAQALCRRRARSHQLSHRRCPSGHDPAAGAVADRCRRPRFTDRRLAGADRRGPLPHGRARCRLARDGACQPGLTRGLHGPRRRGCLCRHRRGADRAAGRRDDDAGHRHRRRCPGQHRCRRRVDDQRYRHADARHGGDPGRQGPLYPGRGLQRHGSAHLHGDAGHEERLRSDQPHRDDREHRQLACRGQAMGRCSLWLPGAGRHRGPDADQGGCRHPELLHLHCRAQLRDHRRAPDPARMPEHGGSP